MEVLFFEAADESPGATFQRDAAPAPPARGSLRGGWHCTKERKALQVVRERADRIIDTSKFNVHELKGISVSITSPMRTAKASLLDVRAVVRLQARTAAGRRTLSSTCRFLPNPYFVQGLRDKTGRDREVAEYLERHRGIQAVLFEGGRVC